LWDDDPAKYRANLDNEGYHAWLIDSAVGFEGFVVAKKMTQPEPNGAANRTQPVGSQTNGTSAAAGSGR
jgi:hypothetical protein